MSAARTRQRRPARRFAFARNERPLGAVPALVWVLLALAFLAQLAVGSRLGEGRQAVAQALPAPPASAGLRLLVLGDSIAASRLLMLWLQAFDNQPGISLPLHSLDYERVIGWLDLALTLDPASHYPLLNATRIYAQVNDPAKSRRMLDFVHAKFLEAPNARWRWLADASLMAKHRLEDRPLALRYARALAEHATGANVPFWARDMRLILLTEMGEYEAARGIIAALLESGEIVDRAELRFLSAQLEEIVRLDTR